MVQMTSRQLIEQLSPLGVSGNEFEFSGVEIDSRKDCSGVLFVAIRGENFDGHDFVANALDKGAVAAIVEKELAVNIPQIRVANCKQALADIATAWRQTMQARVIAITGSNGKTTVKEMLGRILSTQQPSLITAGNLNNDIGVPLTLFRLAPEHRFAVIEMGANHLDEIRQLVAIAQPDIVYVNNARPAHVEGFGSLANVVSAKGEMYRHCQPDSLAVFNDDEPAAAQWKDSAVSTRRLSFSMHYPADVKGSFDTLEQGIRLRTEYRGEQADCELKVAGSHNAQNALAAVALALAAGLELPKAVAGLSGFSGVSGRQQYRRGIGDCLIIDDSYNANPDSLAAAVDVLCQLPGQAWLALGDMAELGDDSQVLHDQAVASARDKGVMQFFALGEKSCQAARLFGDHGYCFSGHQEMANAIRGRLNKEINLLIKGSRSARMEKLVDALILKSSPSNQAGERHAV